MSIGDNVLIRSAGVSSDGIFSFSSSGETPALHTSPPKMGALHTYSFEVPQYFGLYIFKNTISYMIKLFYETAVTIFIFSHLNWYETMKFASQILVVLDEESGNHEF